MVYYLDDLLWETLEEIEEKINIIAEKKVITLDTLEDLSDIKVQLKNEKRLINQLLITIEEIIKKENVI
jgi:hypothetical protein